MTMITKMKIIIAVMLIACATTAIAQHSQTYVVQRGETIASIAKKHGLTETELRQANPDLEDIFFVGMKLNIPASSSVSPASSASTLPQVSEKGSSNEDYQQRNNVASSDAQTTHTQDNTNVLQSVVDNSNSGEGFGTVGLMYYGFDGFEEYGVYLGGAIPNNFSYEMGLRHYFISHGHTNMDIMLNYSFGLWLQDTNQLLFTLNVGPSMRIYDQPTDKVIGETVHYETKFACDCAINPRITVKLGKFSLTGGFFYWAPKFKFNKDDGATSGFNVGIGYVIM